MCPAWCLDRYNLCSLNMRVKPYIVSKVNLSMLVDEKVDKPGSVPLAR